MTAGDLIRKAKVAGDARRRVRVRDGNEAQDNQSILIEEFRKVTLNSSASVVLDGHFVIPSEAGPTSVHPEVFSSLGVQVLTVLLVDPLAASTRLRARPERARWWDQSVTSLEHLQNLELAAAQRVAIDRSLALVELSKEPKAVLKEILTGNSGPTAAGSSRQR